MSESQTSACNKPRQVRIQERAISVGNVVGVNGYRVNLALLKQRFSEGGYQLHETPHFLLFRREQAPSTILVHWFPPEAIDADLERFFLQELKPVGVLDQPQDFGDAFGAVVGSLYPYDVHCAWHLYAVNTLCRYDDLLKNAQSLPANNSNIHTFAALYRQVLCRLTGNSLLDAGCSSGFLPLLIAERKPFLSQIVGVDIRPEPFVEARKIAGERKLANVKFVQADLLSEDIITNGQFDTVTALHVLEHFNEADMYRVLAKLLNMASRQLIIAVPYEEGEPERVYGHEQLFTPAKLEAVGQRCLQQWGSGEMLYEDCAGGLLIVRRADSSVTTE